jgi:hypothetical protein
VRGNDFLNQAVGEIILFGICTHVLERLTGQRGLRGRANKGRSPGGTWFSK